MDGRNGRLIRCVIVQLIRAASIINALAISPLNTEEGSVRVYGVFEHILQKYGIYTIILKKNDIFSF